MHRLIYTSHATAPPTGEALAALLRQSRQWNETHGIIGVLFYGFEQFVQVLEGSAADLDTLYGRLMLDTRHHSMIQLSYKRTPR